MSRTRTGTLVLILVGVVAIALALGRFLERPPAGGLTTGAASLPPVFAFASYSDVVKAMRQHRITAADVDIATGKTTLVYRDQTMAKAELPVQDGTLLRELSDSGADVTVVGTPGGSGGGSEHRSGGGLLASLIAWLLGGGAS